MDIQETLQFIGSVNWKGSVPGLERISELLRRMGNPQDSLRYVHIGGTNGKGSTAAFLSHILREAGYKTGLYISPFVEIFNERMQINNQYISDEELAQIASDIRPIAEAMEDAPTEFELYTAIALEYFARNHCDIVVLEVGMGGEFDATNVIRCPEVAVLTAIGLDHTAYLGNTVEEIAATKSGIIKEGSRVVLYRQGKEVTRIIAEKCDALHVPLVQSDPDALELLQADIDGQTFQSPFGELTIHLAAAYQKFNLAVVLKTVEVMREIGYSITDRQIQTGLAATTWPGRFEVLGKNPVFLIDGAHNPHGMNAAVQSLRAVFPDQKLILIFGVLADKDYPAMLDMILPLAKEVFCVAPDNERALPAEDLARAIHNWRPSMNIERGLSDAASSLPVQNTSSPFISVSAKAFSSVSKAVDHAYAAADPDEIICTIGSLYMISEVKHYFQKNFRKDPNCSYEEFPET